MNFFYQKHRQTPRFANLNRNWKVCQFFYIILSNLYFDIIGFGFYIKIFHIVSLKKKKVYYIDTFLPYVFCIDLSINLLSYYLGFFCDIGTFGSFQCCKEKNRMFSIDLIVLCFTFSLFQYFNKLFSHPFI